MKIYYHPASTTSRPVMLFALESGIAMQPEVVDLFKGQHLGPVYSALNPNRLIPLLEDGDFLLTESSAILKYLADSIGSPAYPADTRQRARVNERMDWFNTQLSRDLAYGFIYPQIFPQHRWEKPYVQEATLKWHKAQAKQWLQVLDTHIIGPRAYVCGAEISIADYLGVAIVALGEVARIDYGPYPNITRWLSNMKRLASWNDVYAAIDGYAASIASNQFEPLDSMELEAG